MAGDENKAVIRQYYAAMSGREKTVVTLDTYIADGDVALKQHIVMTEAAFPAYELLVDDMFAEGEMVAVRGTFKGVHQGPLGDIPATGKSVRQPFIIIYRVRDGRIVAHWMSIDNLALMQQLGILPVPGAA